MLKINRKIIWLTLIIFLVVEALSFSGFIWPVINTLTFIIILVTAIALTVYGLEYGLLIIFTELFIGSLGHLFYINIGSQQLPIRIALWAAVMSVFFIKFLIQLIKLRKAAPYWLSLKTFSGLKTFAWLSIFILIGVINGLGRGHNLPLVFSDFNSWLYFLMLLPVVVVYGSGDKLKIERLQNIFLAAAIWLSFKTLVLLFIFTHNVGIAPDIYLWLRKTLVGEMTPTKTGWPRIFIQGQVYSAIAFFFAFWFNQAGFKFKEFFKQSNIITLIFAGWFLSAVLISFSRSFWVALIGVLIFSLLLIWKIQSFQKMLTAAAWYIATGVMSFIFIYLVVAFPYIHLPSTDFSSNFLDRVNSGNEAALASRWSLLPVLFKEIQKEPFLGQGYGATVTYFSSDPRILENNPSGKYTTYAFEWGYLDLWLKLGLLGLVAYLFLLIKMVIDGLKKGLRENNTMFFALVVSILFLMITHAFTPYLNHPLGIGFLLISSCLIWSNRVY